MTDRTLPPGGPRDALSIDGMARYADVEALAFAIVHALEDRDSGLIAEVDALRRQVAALATMTDRAMSPALDVTALEAIIEQQPELGREPDGVVEHLLDSARSGRPAAPTTTALLLMALPITQSLARRHNEIEREIRSLRQEVGALCEEVANLSHVLMLEQSQKQAPVAAVAAIQNAVRHEIEPLRQEVAELREEVRAQLGILTQGDELRSVHALIAAELERLRERALPVDAHEQRNRSTIPS